MLRSIEEVLAAYERPIESGEAENIDGVLQLDLTGRHGRTCHLYVEDGMLRVRSGRYDNPAATVVVDAEDFVRINRGEVTLFEAAMDGRLRVAGSLPLANRFQALLLKRS